MGETAEIIPDGSSPGSEERATAPPSRNGPGSALTLAGIGVLLALAFGALDFFVVWGAMDEAIASYIKLFGRQGSTMYNIALYLEIMFVFPLGMVILLGVVGPLTYRVFVHKNFTHINPYLTSLSVAAICWLSNMTPEAKIPIFYTVFLPMAVIAGVETFVYCLAFNRMLKYGGLRAKRQVRQM